MSALNTIITACIAFVSVALVTPLVRRYALRWKLGDKPNGRKIQTDTIPHLGGIAIFLGVVIAVSIALPNFADGFGGWAKTLIPIIAILVLGLVDDLKNLKARQKLTVQIIAALSLAMLGHHLFVGIAFIDHSAVLVVLLTTFYLVGISSSVNLIDGHDGLAAGLCAISAGAFAFVAYLLGAPGLYVVSIAVVGACAGFLLYNFPPGKIFMGDTGSMFLGVTLGVIACSLTMVEPGIRTFVAVTFILSIPILDTFLAIARRSAQRVPVFQADHNHIHHMLASFGFSPRQTLLILYSLQAVMALLGVLVVMGFVIPLVLGILLLLAMFFTFIRVMVVTEATVEAAPAKFAPGSIPTLGK